MKRYIQGLVLVGLVLVLSGCRTTLMKAAQEGDLPLIKSELKDGANIEGEPIASKFTPLSYAVAYDQFDAVKLLVKKGANIHHRLSMSTLLSLAIDNGNFEMLKYLVEKGVDVNQTPLDRNYPPLGEIVRAHFTKKMSYAKSLNMFIYLIENGARISNLDNTIWGPYKGDLVNGYNQHLRSLQENKKRKIVQKKKQEAIKKAKIKKANDEIKVNNYIAKSDFEGLKNFTDRNPNAVYYIKDNSVRLLFTGPKGLKVGDIRKLIKNNRSEAIIISLINRAKEPYKEYTMDEIDILTKFGISDNIIAAMINRTTKLLEDKQRKKEQEFLLAEQQRIANQKTKVVYRDNPNQKVDSQGNPIIEAVQDELIKQGAKMLFDKLF